MPNAKVLIRQSFKPLTKEKKLEVWNKVKARIATGEYCEITAKEYVGLSYASMKRSFYRQRLRMFKESTKAFRLP